MPYNSPMATTCIFIDDPALKQALAAASAAAMAELARVLPELATQNAGLSEELQAAMAALLTRPPGDHAPLVNGPDAFGDRFDLATLPLARPGTGYAVQLLDTDTLLDRESASFLPVRDSRLQGLFPDFDSAFAAAKNWLQANNTCTEAHPLAIVPACMDAQLERHVLIYGVLTRSP